MPNRAARCPLGPVVLAVEEIGGMPSILGKTSHTPESIQTLLKEGQNPIPSERYESGQGSYTPHQVIYFLLRSHTLHGLHHIDHIGVRLNSLLADHVSKELSRGYIEDKFIWIEPKGADISILGTFQPLGCGALCYLCLYPLGGSHVASSYLLLSSLYLSHPMPCWALHLQVYEGHHCVKL
ncbi:hypothetical protein LIER_23498 [Lithospermum erythrorhizon]|uniref:Uncharacterized protein n=1 Tax=Lithospermum erythrorhizon TaxID=34254 RepID=A0AAV3QY01_LITER